jgi:acyl-CoA thioesterase FadM
MKVRMMMQQQRNRSDDEGDNQCQAHRFLQRFLTPGFVWTRDMDEALLHMSNSRYSRHADFARFKLIIATGFLAAVESLGCGLAASTISQKFRRKMGLHQRYQIWLRFVGWDERHFYVEHIFVVDASSSRAPVVAANRQEEDERIRQQIVLDGSLEAVKDVVDLQTRNFHRATTPSSSRGMSTNSTPNYVIASILTVRMTTARNKPGKIVTPSQVVHYMGLSDVLPGEAPPPKDMVQQ